MPPIKFGMQKKENWFYVESRLWRFKKLIAAFNRKRLSKDCSIKDFTKEDFAELSLIYRPKDGMNTAVISRTKHILSDERTIRIADEQLIDAMSKTGVTKEWLLNQRKGLLEQSMEDRDRRMAHVVLTRLEDIVGMSPIIITQQQRTSNSEDTPIDYGSLENKKSIDEVETTEPPKQIEANASDSQ